MASDVQPRSLSRAKRIWLEWRGFIYFVFVMLLFRSAIADWNQVPSGSMEPNIMIGDRIVVDKISYDLRFPFTLTRIARWGDPKRGDIVTFPNPLDGEVYVKRLVAVSGDTVEVNNNRLIINGEVAKYTPVDKETTAELSAHLSKNSIRSHRLVKETILGSERYVMRSKSRGRSAARSYGPVTVPEGTFFVMGDNRDNSSDSRQFGFLERDSVLGRAYAIAFSVDTSNYYQPRVTRFFTDLE